MRNQPFKDDNSIFYQCHYLEESPPPPPGASSPSIFSRLSPSKRVSSIRTSTAGNNVSSSTQPKSPPVRPVGSVSDLSSPSSPSSALSPSPTPFSSSPQDKSSMTQSATWQCPICTFVNNYQAQLCGMCEALNPRLKSRRCGTCTYINDGHDKPTCSLCGTSLVKTSTSTSATTQTAIPSSASSQPNSDHARGIGVPPTPPVDDFVMPSPPTPADASSEFPSSLRPTLTDPSTLPVSKMPLSHLQGLSVSELQSLLSRSIFLHVTTHTHTHTN